MLLISVIVILSILGGFIQSVTGFGTGIVIMLGLPYLLAVPQAAAVTGVINLGVSLTNAWHYRKHLQPIKVLLPTLVMVIVSGGTVFFVLDIDMNLVKLCFGIFFVLLALYFIRFAGKMDIKATPFNLAMCGGISGITAGFFGIGGPLIALSYVNMTDSKEEYLGSTQFTFCFTALAATLTRAYNGILGWHLMGLALIGIVTIQIGRLLGQRYVDRINDRQLRKIVYAMVGISGLLTIYTSLHG